MKKQNNISALARKAFYTALAVLFCTACSDNAWEDNSPLVKEGVPVSVNFRFETSSMEKISTRSLTEEQEWKMHDLYLFIFDKNGNKKKGTKYYTEAELTNHHNYSPGTTNPTGGTLNIETTSGESYIYGIANVGANELGGVAIKNALDRVETIDGLKGIQATLSNPGNIDRNSDNLVMSGTYKPSETSTETDGRCTILPTDTRLGGKLYLKRLDSHISFEIEIDNQEITGYKFNSWQVFNVPVKSNLILQESDAVGASDKDYKDSGLQNQFITSKDRTSTFSFYMLENRKNAKGDISESEYEKREKEEKQANGKNYDRPKYEYADEYATYVEIKGELNFKKANGTHRYANVCYKVHLGYVNDDATDFKSERNKKYTYRMTIRDVNSIILEVENGDESQPGAEGDVVDAKTQIYELDAHYNCFNIGFTWNEISEGSGFTFRVKTPFGEVDQNSTGDEKTAGDYKWIKFVRTSSESALASYPNSPTGIKYLFDLKEDMRDRGAESRPNVKYYYTVFIDEYFYETPPGNQTWDDPYWKHFVNKENREALILLSPKVSADGNSSYADAQYLITQKSIQTYYSTTDLNSTGTALGIEHVNEENIDGRGQKRNPNLKGSGLTISELDKNNGAWNTWQYIKKNGYIWGDENHKGYCDLNAAANPPFYTFKMEEVKAWAECLSRNRDNDGDGEIDADELRWYLPTDNQLASIFLGAPSLPSPLFDANKIQTVGEFNPQYHYAASNYSKVWSDEGCSFGDPYYIGGPEALRCVRNLGIEDGADVKNNVVSPAYTYDKNTRTFTMKMDEKNIRTGIIENAEIPSHDNFSPNNRPYSKFQVAKNFAKDIIDHGYAIHWSEHFLLSSGKSVCAEYTEDGENDKGSWRAPNQRELLIMYVQNPDLVINTKNKVKYGSYSCSNWKYVPSRQFGINTGKDGASANPLLYLDSGYAFSPSTIRCVRDVK